MTREVYLQQPMVEGVRGCVGHPFGRQDPNQQRQQHPHIVAHLHEGFKWIQLPMIFSFCMYNLA